MARGTYVAHPLTSCPWYDYTLVGVNDTVMIVRFIEAREPIVVVPREVRGTRKGDSPSPMTDGHRTRLSREVRREARRSDLRIILINRRNASGHPPPDDESAWGGPFPLSSVTTRQRRVALELHSVLCGFLSWSTLSCTLDEIINVFSSITFPDEKSHPR